MGTKIYIPFDARDYASWKIRNTVLNNSGREVASALQNAKYLRRTAYLEFDEATYPAAISFLIGWNSAGTLSTNVADPANVLGTPVCDYDEDHLFIVMGTDHPVSGVHGLYASDTGATPAEDNKVTWLFSSSSLEGQMVWHDTGDNATKLDCDVALPYTPAGAKIAMWGTYYSGTNYTATSFFYHPTYGYLEGSASSAVPSGGDRADWPSTWSTVSHGRFTWAISGSSVNPKFYGFAWLNQPASENRFADRATQIPLLYAGWLANNKRLPSRWTGSRQIYRRLA